MLSPRKSHFMGSAFSTSFPLDANVSVAGARVRSPSSPADTFDKSAPMVSSSQFASLRGSGSPSAAGSSISCAPMASVFRLRSASPLRSASGESFLSSSPET